MDLNDVRIFAAVGQEGTLSAAGKRLKLPPSTISRSLTRLEENLGAQLIRRTSRGFTLTEAGTEYLQSCQQALRSLNAGSARLAAQRNQPHGTIRVACPVTMLRTLFGPLLHLFLEHNPYLRIEINPYNYDWNQEPSDDVDVFFKVRAPRDSRYRVRLFPGVARDTFASNEYLTLHGTPVHPDDLVKHSCIGSGIWKFSRGDAVQTPNVPFRVESGDPYLHLELALHGVGIAILPLYMARNPEHQRHLARVLPDWETEPITLCALYSGPSKLTPKVQVFLDFLSEYIGTPLDPRLRGISSEGIFTPPTDVGKGGP